MELTVRGKREVNPLLLNLGIALALSLAGYFFSQFRWPPRLRPPPPSDGLKNEEASAKITNDTSTTTSTSIVGLSPSSKARGDEEGFLLPEFDDLVLKEFEAIGCNHKSSTKKSEMEQEVAHLRRSVLSLRERERCLELNLLEYYGMQEQESAVRELESQLKINNLEAKLYSLKIESLQSENRKLQEEVADYSRTMAELVAARGKIKLLKKRLKSDAELTKDKIASLRQEIGDLQQREKSDHEILDDAEVEEMLKKLEELEDEAKNLTLINSNLAQENTDLKQKLESMQMLQSSIHEVTEMQAEALEEVDGLREENDKLTKEIDQLRIDRCTDVEELVYLRWLNACLRYELRNYRAPPGKTTARDLSKNLCPKSEEMAKELIIEYANSGTDEKKSLGHTEFDSENSTSSPSSTVESDDTPTEVSFTTRHGKSSKSKFFNRLKKAVLRKKIFHNCTSDRASISSANSERRVSIYHCSIDDRMTGESYDSFSSCMTDDVAAVDKGQPNKDSRSPIYARHSLDIQRNRRLNAEEHGEEKGKHFSDDIGTDYRYKRITSGEGELIGFGQNNLSQINENDISEKVKLKKFAAALKRSREATKLCRRSTCLDN
ncbi:protein CHUP1, chloroplastic-like isoform X1 [Typha latifolia]|uniref:protein CHUP1, chloroplastic-like isoform X1 n=1 Tax=Typha latifolia TaxID=4733 RepID=UPI003C2B6D4B